MIEVELINLVLGTKLDVVAFHAFQYCLRAEIKTLTFALRHFMNSNNLRRASFRTCESSTVQPKEFSIVRWSSKAFFELRKCSKNSHMMSQIVWFILRFQKIKFYVLWFHLLIFILHSVSFSFICGIYVCVYIYIYIYIYKRIIC